MEASPGTLSTSVTIAALVFTTVFSIHRLNGMPHEINFGATIHALLPILTSTLGPALKLCVTWRLAVPSSRPPEALSEKNLT
jgi:hypothetical protein